MLSAPIPKAASGPRTPRGSTFGKARTEMPRPSSQRPSFARPGPRSSDISSSSPLHKVQGAAGNRSSIHEQSKSLKVFDELRACLINSHGSILRGWRCEFDTDGDLCCSFESFCAAAKRLKFQFDVVGLFNVRADNHRELFFEDVDPHCYQLVLDARQWIHDQFGGTDEFFTAIDTSGDEQISVSEFEDACREHGWHRSHQDMTILFEGLDLDGAGLVTKDELIVLELDPTERQDLRNALGEEEANQKQDLLSRLYNEFRSGEYPEHSRFAQRPWHTSLTELPEEVLRKRQERRQAEGQATANAVGLFRKHVRDVYGNEVRAWRRALDPQRTNSITKKQLLAYCASIHFPGDGSALYRGLERDTDGSIGLEELTPNHANILGAFRHWAVEKFGACGNLWDTQAFRDAEYNAKLRKRIQEKKEERKEDSGHGAHATVESGHGKGEDKTKMKLSSRDFIRACMELGYAKTIYEAATRVTVHEHSPKSHEAYHQHIVEVVTHNVEQADDMRKSREILQRSTRQSIANLGLVSKLNVDVSEPEMELKLVAIGIDYHGCGFVRWEDLDWLDSWSPPVWLSAKPDSTALRELKTLLIDRFHTMIAAWRRCLDTDGSNKVSWAEFVQASERLRFKGNIAGAWRALDIDLSGWISLNELDPVSHHLLVSFKHWATRHFRSVGAAFRNLDKDNSGSLTFSEIRKATKQLKWDGDPRLLFEALDMSGGTTAAEPRRTIDLDEIAFLDGYNEEIPTHGDVLEQPQFSQSSRRSRSLTSASKHAPVYYATRTPAELSAWRKSQDFEPFRPEEDSTTRHMDRSRQLTKKVTELWMQRPMTSQSTVSSSPQKVKPLNLGLWGPKPGTSPGTRRRKAPRARSGSGMPHSVPGSRGEQNNKFIRSGPLPSIKVIEQSNSSPQLIRPETAP